MSNQETPITFNSYEEVMGASKEELRAYAEQHEGIELHHATGLVKLRENINDINNFVAQEPGVTAPEVDGSSNDFPNQPTDMGVSEETTETLEPPKISDAGKPLAEILGQDPVVTDNALKASVITSQDSRIQELEAQLAQAKNTAATTGKTIVQTCDTPNGVMSPEQVEQMYGFLPGESNEDRARKLVRIRVTSNNPEEAKLDSIMFSPGAALINGGKCFRRVVPFNVEGGCFVENIIYLNMKEATCELRDSEVVGTGAKTHMQVNRKVISAYNIEVLALPTEEELEQMRKKEKGYK